MRYCEVEASSFKEGYGSCDSCTRLDYCNSLYSGLPQSASSRLQAVQNDAARLLIESEKMDHISSVLSSLHVCNCFFLLVDLFVRCTALWISLYCV